MELDGFIGMGAQCVIAMKTVCPALARECETRSSCFLVWLQARLSFETEVHPVVMLRRP